jgi:capsid protein
MPRLLNDAKEETPLRTVVFSSYYDATATTKDRDYGNFVSAASEDFYFSSSQRWIAIARTRREVRNNPYLAGFVFKYPEAIGYAMLRSTTADREYNVAKTKWWRRLSKRMTSAGDTLRTLERLVKLELLVAGELFLVERLDGTVQVIPSEFCGSPLSAPVEIVANGLKEVNGIVYDAADNRVYYRFGRLENGGISFTKTELVEAKYVIHIYDKDRVHQGRGLPWLLPCLPIARDLYEITRSKTKQIKDANSISGFIEKTNSSEMIEGMSAPELDDDGETPKAAKPDDPADPIKKDPIVIEMRPGMFIALEPGEKIESLMSNYNATDYKELILLMLHAMSSPIGLPVELWFSGLGDVNYSGYKGLGVQWNGRRQDVIEFLVSRFYDPLYLWRVGKATNEGELPANPDGDEELIEWVFRRTPILDDEKEGKSNKVKLESGETDLAEIWAEKGYTEEEVFARRRQLWIKLQLAAGELDEGVDTSTVKVPIDFLFRNELPGETTVPHIPDGTGISSETIDQADAAAADAVASAAEAKAAATEAQQLAAELAGLLRQFTQKPSATK